jgi:hypothetical protein
MCHHKQVAKHPTQKLGLAKMPGSMMLVACHVESLEHQGSIIRQTAASWVKYRRMVDLCLTIHLAVDYFSEVYSGNVEMIQTDQPYVLQIHNECKHFSLHPTHCHNVDIS